MTTGLVRHGNRVDLIIAKVMLELVDLMMDTPLEMTADGIHIVISPRRTEEEDLLNASLNRINDRVGITFSRFGAKKTALCVLIRSVSQGIYRHEWPQQESLRDDRYGQLQPLREPPICYPEVGSQDSEDRRRHRLGGRRPLDHLRNMGRADRPEIRKERELKRRRNENGLRVVRRTASRSGSGEGSGKLD